MKNTLKILALSLLILSQSCKKNNCEDNLCFTPPSPFLFDIVDKTTGENLFTNGTFEPSQIEIRNLNDNSHVGFNFMDENNYNIISINSIGWDTEIVNMMIKIDSNDICSLFVDAERMSENCCSFTRYHQISIEGSAYELDSETGIYNIKIE